MMGIKAADLIDVFERMAREHWSYEWGAAREGCVDCSGAFVWAYKQLGGPTIAHGSNSIYRQSIGTVGSAAMPGYAAFKVRAWTDAQKNNRWYGTEPGNVYHIGLVDSTGKYVLNAQGAATGFSRDNVKTFTCFAPLLAVDYEEGLNNMEMEEETMLCSAVVCTKDDPLTLRDSPNGTKIGKLPKGCTVTVLAERDGWMQVRYGSLRGWASGEYLFRIGVKENAPQSVTVQLVIRDEAGREFRPVGGVTVDVETSSDSSVD